MNSVYKCVALSELRKAARAMIEDSTSVRHLALRAYCIAKPGAFCAVFAVAPDDAEPQVRDKPDRIVTNESAVKVQLGDWCSLAYITCPTHREDYVVSIMKRSWE